MVRGMLRNDGKVKWRDKGYKGREEMFKLPKILD